MDATGRFSEAARHRIMLVEDDNGVRRSLQLVLQARGYDVRAYASGHMLATDPAAMNAVCLIADYHMPEFNGLAVLKALRAAGWPGPAILITAFNRPGLTQEALDAGYSHIVEKPLRENVLADMVARLVERGPPPPG